MLVIFTASDETDAVLKILSTCAVRFIKKANTRVTVKLGPRSSSAARIRKALAEKEDLALFFFGHGELPPEGLIASDQTSAVHSKNLLLLKNRLVFAASCYSAQSLIGAAKKHGATVIGYHGELQVSFRPADRKRQTNCVLSAALALLAGSDAETASRLAVAEFDKTADTLIKGSATDRVIAAAVFRSNAQELRLAGKNRKM